MNRVPIFVSSRVHSVFLFHCKRCLTCLVKLNNIRMRYIGMTTNNYILHSFTTNVRQNESALLFKIN